MRYKEGNCVIRWLALCLLVTTVVALSLVAFSADQQGRFASLTIEQLLGIRVDVGNPLLAFTLPQSGLALGVGSSLDLLGGDLSIRAFPPRKPAVDVTGTVLLTTGPVRSLCYFITAYINDKEFLLWFDVLLAVLKPGEGWSIQLQWKTYPELADLLRFGAQTGYRVYRRVVPENEQGVVCDTSDPDIQLVEEFPSDPNQTRIVFTDGGKPAIGPAGPLSLQNPMGNLNVGNLGTIGALRVGQVAAPASGCAFIQKSLRVGDDAKVSNNLGVGTAAPAGGPGDAHIASRLGVGFAPAATWPAGSARINNSLSVGAVVPPGGAGDGQFTGNVGIGGAPTLPARLNIVNPLGANIYLDATATPSVMNFGGQVWQIISTGLGDFAINDMFAPGGGPCCLGRIPGNPRFVIDSQGRVGMGCTPAGPAGAGSLEVAKSLGVGMAAPNVCGGINTCGPVNMGGAVAVGGGLGVGVAAPEGLGNADIGNDLFVVNDAGIGNDLGVIRDAGIGNNLVVGNDAGIARDLNVGRDASVLNDLVVANNAEVFGDLTVWGTKFFAQPHPTDSTKVITYAALEGPEAGAYVRGTAQLIDGEAIIELPESFRLVTAEEGLTAQVTLLEDCNGLYVAEKSTARIVVKELMNGTSNGRFDYLVQGVRKGYEDFEPIRAGARNES